MGTMKLFATAKGTSLQITRSKLEHRNWLMHSKPKAPQQHKICEDDSAIVSLQKVLIQISESISNKCQTLFSMMNTELKLCAISIIKSGNRSIRRREKSTKNQ